MRRGETGSALRRIKDTRKGGELKEDLHYTPLISIVKKDSEYSRKAGDDYQAKRSEQKKRAERERE